MASIREFPTLQDLAEFARQTGQNQYGKVDCIMYVTNGRGLAICLEPGKFCKRYPKRDISEHLCKSVPMQQNLFNH